MKCNDIKEILPDYLDKNLSGNDKNKFESHIEQCVSCSTKLEQFKDLNNKFSSIKFIESTESFKKEFYRKLENEKYKMQNKIPFYTSFKSLVKIAAAVLLFAGGTLFGIKIEDQRGVKTKLSFLEQEVSQLTQQVHLTALREKTPSEKILAIEYLNFSEINRELLNTFNFLLNNDESINVRLEAAQALYKLSANQEARDILLKSLNANQKPIVQIKLINYLSEIEEHRIIEPLKDIIHDGKTNRMVKDYAQTSLQTLI